jgi:hypothetical protein
MYPRLYAALLLACLFISTPAIADANACGSGTVTTFPGSDNVFTVTKNSDGTYAVSFCSPTKLDLPPFPSFAIADVNQDGSPDMLFGDSSDADAGIQVLLNNGTGIVVLDKTLATGAQKADGPRAISATDLNSDGWPDIVTDNAADGTVSVLLSDGDGGFSAPRLYAAGASISGLVVQDLNGDGAPDIVTGDSVNGGLDVLLNDGHGSFMTAVSYLSGFPLTQIQTQDMNGDGMPDIVAYTVGAGAQVVLLNNGNGTFTIQRTTTPPGGGGVDLSGCNSTCLSLLGSVGLITSGGSAAGGGSSVVGTVTGGTSISITTSGATATGGAKTGGSSSKATSGSTASGGGGGLDGLSLLLLGFMLRRRVNRVS